LLAAAALTLWVDKESKVHWSPYQKLTLTPITDKKEIIAYSLNTNDTWYQHILNLSPNFLERHPEVNEGLDPRWNAYNVPYQFAPAPRSVLVLGSGTGNDVAAALRNSNARITAIEIDPLILELGEKLHFEKPYQSDRVQIINDDARSYIQNSPDKFDLILFSLLDSHTTASSFSNIRLDNFVYTQEALARAGELLNADGLLIVKFQVQSPWIAHRLSGLLQHAFHQTPFQIVVQSQSGLGGFFYIIGSPETMRRIALNPNLSNVAQPAVTESHVPLTSDDWPYFYQKERRLPAAVLGMGGFLIVFSWYLVRRLLGSRPQELTPAWNIHFFLLGAGFMLLEAQIISKMALLFGTTWIVNSIVVAGILLLIVISNLIFEAWKSYPLAVPYLGIIVSALPAYFIPMRSLLFEHVGARIVIATLLLCLPVLFAGMVFIRSFSEAHFSGAALGWNLIGAVLGGMLETVSQATGIRALVLIAIGLYIGSWVAGSRKKVAQSRKKKEERVETEAVAGEALAGVL
jgi:SAM-dependent methyltransferase